MYWLIIYLIIPDTIVRALKIHGIYLEFCFESIGYVYSLTVSDDSRTGKIPVVYSRQGWIISKLSTLGYQVY